MLTATDRSRRFELLQHGVAAPEPEVDVSYAFEILKDRIEQLEYALGHISESFADSALQIGGFKARLDSIDAGVSRQAESGGTAAAGVAEIGARLKALEEAQAARDSDLSARIDAMAHTEATRDGDIAARLGALETALAGAARSDAALVQRLDRITAALARWSGSIAGGDDAPAAAPKRAAAETGPDAPAELSSLDLPDAAADDAATCRSSRR